MSKIISFNDVLSDDGRPLPERIASLYGFQLTPRNEGNKRYYAVQDWIKGIAPTSSVRKIWNRMKYRHPQLSTRCRQLPYVAKDRKTYQIDYADAETLYLITQHMEANSGNRDAVLLYLAKAGVVLDELIRDPDKAEAMFAELADEKEYRRLLNEGLSHEEALQWLDVRHNQKQEWKQLTSEWKARGISDGFEYARLTNDVHQVATGKTATDMKRTMGIRKTSREYLSAAENAAIEIASVTSRMLHKKMDSQGIDELSEDVKSIKPMMDASRPEIERLFSQKRRRLPPPKPSQNA